MEKQSPLMPSISVNIKYSQILIHKNSLRLLGNPEYIQILVNPEEKSIILCCSVEEDHLAHAVNPKIFDSREKGLCIRSHPLMKNLYRLNPVWNVSSTYKIKGRFFPNLNIIKFKIKDSCISSKFNKSEAMENE